MTSAEAEAEDEPKVHPEPVAEPLKMQEPPLFPREDVVAATPAPSPLPEPDPIEIPLSEKPEILATKDTDQPPAEVEPVLLPGATMEMDLPAEPQLLPESDEEETEAVSPTEKETSIADIEIPSPVEGLDADIKAQFTAPITTEEVGSAADEPDDRSDEMKSQPEDVDVVVEQSETDESDGPGNDDEVSEDEPGWWTDDLVEETTETTPQVIKLQAKPAPPVEQPASHPALQEAEEWWSEE
jgi:hypothetical protein